MKIMDFTTNSMIFMNKFKLIETFTSASSPARRLDDGDSLVEYADMSRTAREALAVTVQFVGFVAP